jgi:hypothetical protein
MSTQIIEPKLVVTSLIHRARWPLLASADQSRKAAGHLEHWALVAIPDNGYALANAQCGLRPVSAHYEVVGGMMN